MNKKLVLFFLLFSIVTAKSLYSMDRLLGKDNKSEVSAGFKIGGTRYGVTLNNDGLTAGRQPDAAEQALGALSNAMSAVERGITDIVNDAHEIVQDVRVGQQARSAQAQGEERKEARARKYNKRPRNQRVESSRRLSQELQRSVEDNNIEDASEEFARRAKEHKQTWNKQRSYYSLLGGLTATVLGFFCLRSAFNGGDRSYVKLVSGVGLLGGGSFFTYKGATNLMGRYKRQGR